MKITYETYKHFDQEVYVRSDLRGQHRKHCLCFLCKRFNAKNRKNNCRIANAVYGNCVKFNIVTPVWECPDFIKTENVDGR